MWKLTIEDDEGKQTSLPLSHEEYGVGRGEGNAIRLTDRNISRKHASFRKNGQGWLLRDLESYNGIYVNGTRVSAEQLVTNGDVVQLGDYRLELLDEALAPAPQVPTGLDPMAPQAPLAPGQAPQRPNRLVMVVGPTPGAEYPLDREHVSIGRAEEATISINHSSVSRLHAELIGIGHGRYEVVDKQSANGIRINGVELKRGILEAGDALELGDVRLRFVGAGKLFRADQSQQLPAVIGGFESVAPSVRAPAAAGRAQGSGVAKIVAIGLAVGVVAIGALLIAMRPATPEIASATPEATISPAAGAALLSDARVLLEAKAYEAAHNKVIKIPESSELREDALFKEVEAAWADWVFGEVAQNLDASEQRKLLNRVASTSSVDGERRKKAVEMIEAIEAAQPEPKVAAVGAPAAVGVTSGGTYPDPTPSPSATPTASAVPSAAKTTEPVAAPALPAQGPPDEAAMRRAIEGKVWSGKASVAEIKMLRAICSHQGDKACRDRATSMLQQKESGG